MLENKFKVELAKKTKELNASKQQDSLYKSMDRSVDMPSDNMNSTFDRKS